MEKLMHHMYRFNLSIHILIVVASKLRLNMQVSHTYSKEVAGNPAVAPHLYKFHGILNGIDPDIWDPYNDKFIPVSRFLSLTLMCACTCTLPQIPTRLFFCHFFLPIDGFFFFFKHVWLTHDAFIPDIIHLRQCCWRQKSCQGSLTTEAWFEKIWSPFGRNYHSLNSSERNSSHQACHLSHLRSQWTGHLLSSFFLFYFIYIFLYYECHFILSSACEHCTTNYKNFNNMIILQNAHLL